MPSPRTRTSYMAHRDGAEPEPDDPLLGFAPVPLKQPKRNSLTPERQRKFIAALAATGIVTDAARAAGATMEAFYHLRQREGAEEFRAAWDLAIDRAIGRVEAGALARAIDGEERLVVSGGKVLGVERRFNESLVIFLLKSRRARRYGEEVGPGHPVYERVKAEYEEAERAKRDDPKQIEAIHKSIKMKLWRWRQEIELDWENERQELIAANGGVPPMIDNFAEHRGHDVTEEWRWHKKHGKRFGVRGTPEDPDAR